MEFDADTSAHFFLVNGRSEYIAEPEKLSVWNDSGAGTPLASLLADQASLIVSRPLRSKDKSIITDQRAIQSILSQLNHHQPLRATAARCHFGLSLAFKDDRGNSLGEAGICQSPTGYRLDHPAVFVMPREANDEPIRYGLTIPDARTLADILP
jgi:hypothetical protein